MQFPSDFLNSLRSIQGFDKEAFMNVHDQANIPVSVRKNPFKPLQLEFEIEDAVPWCPNAFYLKERPVFTADPGFHAGCYYVQEASSMFLSYVMTRYLDLGQDIHVLDVCAAPGGKSTLINSLISENSTLVSNEIVKGRSDVLAYNLAKWGTANCIVTNNSPDAFSNLEGVFDFMVIDAPCSGSGLFRKQPEAMDEWSLDNVRSCSIRQKAIIEQTTPALKDGGILFYSTCSYSYEEDDAIVKSAINSGEYELIDILTEDTFNIENSGHGLRFYPYKFKGEGFFCAVLRKTSFTPSQKREKKFEIKEATKQEREIVDPWIKHEGNHTLMTHEGAIKLVNSNTFRLLNDVKRHVYIRKVGTDIGEIKQKDLIPHHFFALSNFRGVNVETLELDKENALLYLKKLPFVYGDIQNGMKLVTYRGYGIGWAKVLSNRINNYLPQNYMIFNKEIGI
jgi:16S rRNA C967 or C1407 C5-methylase (RsmB/RsmF family)/NOL1/NOP2/fmu family ribosome biogenesis protein